MFITIRDNKKKYIYICIFFFNYSKIFRYSKLLDVPHPPANLEWFLPKRSPNDYIKRVYGFGFLVCEFGWILMSVISPKLYEELDEIQIEVPSSDYCPFSLSPFNANQFVPNSLITISHPHLLFFSSFTHTFGLYF